MSPEESKARYNAGTPLGVLNTCIIVAGYLLKEKGILSLDQALVFTDEMTDIAIKVLTGKITISEKGFTDNVIPINKDRIDVV